MKWMAFHKAQEEIKQPSDQPVFLYGEYSIFTARWNKAAGRREKGGFYTPIYYY
jgi:hypothetical protein